MSVNALEKRVAELERELEYERLRARTFETLIEVAERDLQINIKKSLVPNHKRYASALQAGIWA